MKLAIVLGLGLAQAAISSMKPAAKPVVSTTNAGPEQVGSRQIADSKAARINSFLGKIQGKVSRAETAVQARKAAPPAPKKLSRAERKAAKAKAKADARQAIARHGAAEEEEDLLSLSASVSIEAQRRRNSHFSFSESEHYRDCSTTSSSSSSGHKHKCTDKTKKKKKKTGYRLRHVRVHAEQSRTRELSASASLSASVEDLFAIDGSGSLSASAEFLRRRRTVLKCCEDELARKRAHPSRGCEAFARVDYRKKIYFDDDAVRRASLSASLSLSIDAPEEVVQAP